MTNLMKATIDDSDEYDNHNYVCTPTQAVKGATCGLLIKREVKLAGYWQSSFFAFLWTETKSRSINT